MADEQTPAPQPTETVDSFAQKIKAKYPDYANVDNRELTNRIVAKYPEYKARIKPEEFGGGTQAKPQVQAPTGKDWLKSFFWLPKLSRTLGQAGEWAEQKAGEAQTKQQGEIARTGKNPTPMEAYSPRAGYDLLGRVLRLGSGATKPANVAIGGATVLAPGIMGPALMAHGGAGMLEHAGAAKDLVTKGEANPEEAEAFLGSASEAAGGAAARMGMPEGSRTPTSLVKSGYRALVKGQPPNAMVPGAQKAMTQAIQPGVNIPRAQESIQIAGPRIQQLRQAGGLQDLEANPISEIKNTGQALGAIRSAKQHVLGAIEERLGPVAEMQVDARSAGDAMRSSVAKRVRAQFPQQAQAIETRAATYDQPMSLRDVENAIIDANDDLKGLYKQPVAGESPTSAGIKATQAEVKALRSLLDEKVEALSGEGVAGLKREYGALRDMERATARQHAVATRTKEGTLWEGLSYLHAAGDLLSGNALGAARAGAAITVGRMLKTLRNPDFLIEQSFHGPKAFQAAEPIGRAPGPPPPKGMLPAPATEMGAGGEDTSGPVRGGRYTTPAALLPEERPQVAKFIREFRANASETPTAKTSVKGALPERAGQSPTSDIPPIVDPKFVREVISRATDPNRLGARGEGGVRVPPRAKLAGVAESTVPEEARLLVKQTVDMMRSGDRPGRYFDQSEYGDVRLRSRGAQFKGGDWRGVKSMRNMLEWANETEFSPTEMEEAIRSFEESGRMNRVMRSAAEYIQRANKPRMREPGED